MNAESLLAVRLVLHVLTALFLACYFRPDAKFKWFPSLVAAGLLCSSGAMAIQIITTWSVMALQPPQPALTAFLFFVLVPVAWTRGDMATLLDRGSRAHNDLCAWMSTRHK